MLRTSPISILSVARPHNVTVSSPHTLMARIPQIVWLLLVTMALHETQAQEVSPTADQLQYTEVAPVIDGEVDAAWDAARVYAFPDEEGHRFGAFIANPEYTEGPDDFSGQFRALWDENHLFVLVQMRDQEPYADGFSECWRNDGIELLLDGGNEKASSYDANDAYLAFRLGGDEEEWDPDICTLSVLDREKAIANIVYATAVSDTGWVIEVRVPWENVDVTPANGRSIGFNVYANDADGRISGSTPQRDIQRSWAFYSEGNGWQNPASFGTLTFVGGPGGTVANAAFTTDPQTRVLVGESISFDASASTAPGEIVSYAWDFGDGNSGEGVTVTHTYEASGRYIVTLQVSDAEGAEGVAERAVTAWDGVGLPENPLQIPRTDIPPTIDGEREALWANAQRVEIATRANGVLPADAEDLSAEAWLMWDEGNLYVFFDVTDDALFNDSGDNYLDDTPEVYLDGGHERSESYDDNDAQYELSWNSDVISGANPGTSGAAYAFTTREGGTGYTIEVNLPWVNVGLEGPSPGTTIGLELMVNDDDEGGLNRQTKLAWFAPEGSDVAYENPSAFGSAILVEEIQTASESGSELPEVFSIESIYPNPFNPAAKAVVRVSQPGMMEVKVHDVIGRLLHRWEVGASAPGRLEIPIDLSSHPSGVYLVSVRSLETNAVVHATALLLK